MKFRKLMLAFEIGDTVYAKVCQERKPLIVTAFTVKPGGLVTYAASDEDGESWYYDFELVSEFVPDYGS